MICRKYCVYSPKENKQDNVLYVRRESGKIDVGSRDEGKDHRECESP